jgi:hypothetical protein
LKAYDWVTKQRERGNCVISGFHSQIEKDVFDFLIKGKQPVILALARGLRKRFESDLEALLEQNRLLIVTPFDESVTRISIETAIIRNKLMTEIADEIFVAYATKRGNIEKLIRDRLGNGKQISTFALPENDFLIREGVTIYE